MNKDQIAQAMEQARVRAQELLDQEITLDRNREAIHTELERTRGDYRTLKKIHDSWQDAPEKAPLAPPSFPEMGQLPESADSHSESSVKTSKKETK